MLGHDASRYILAGRGKAGGSSIQPSLAAPSLCAVTTSDCGGGRGRCRGPVLAGGHVLVGFCAGGWLAGADCCCGARR